MNDPDWRFIFASVVGSGHLRSGLPCQDASDCRVLVASNGEPVMIAVASDGAGSAKRSDVGAALCCSLFIQDVSALLYETGDVARVSRCFVRGWLEAFQEAVRQRAEAEGLTVRDLACTLLAAVVSLDAGVFVQVGDGSIVISPPDEPNEYCWMFWPQKGEYENTTIFATEPGALESFEYEFGANTYDEVAILTDGLERLALHFVTKTAHAPFFRPMFAPLRSCQMTSLDNLTASLRDFLDSKQVTDRVDDDKTLVLATRRRPQAVHAGAAEDDGII